MLRLVAGQNGRAIVRAMQRLPGFGRSVETARYRMVNGGRVYQVSSFGPVSRGIVAILAGLGINETAEFFIGDDLIPDFVEDVVSALNPFDNVTHPAPVAKSWNNRLTGLQGVKLQDGQLGAEKADGTWTYWRPKKPVAVLYSSGNSPREIIRASKSLKRQSKQMGEVYKMFHPPRQKPKTKIVKVPVQNYDGPETIIAQN